MKKLIVRPTYEVCSRSIRIGIVVVVHWVGCACNQSWHVRTCLSNSWNRFQVAPFAQLAVVDRGSNTCVYVIAIFTMCKSTIQRICWSVYAKTCSFLRTLWQVTSPGYTGTTRRQNSNRHSGRVPRLRDQRRGTRCEAKQRSCYWRFLILTVSYTTSTLPTDKQLTGNSTWRSCDVCVNQFAENNRKNGGMATGSCTTTMRPHTLRNLCRSFWPNTAPLSCSSRHTHQISHRVTFSYSQGLRKFWKDTDLRQRRTSKQIRRRRY